MSAAVSSAARVSSAAMRLLSTLMEKFYLGLVCVYVFRCPLVLFLFGELCVAFVFGVIIVVLVVVCWLSFCVSVVFFSFGVALSDSSLRLVLCVRDYTVPRLRLESSLLMSWVLVLVSVVFA